MVWYFAYGSNMASATLRGRRGIAWQQALAARAHGWRLVFDKPPLLPIGESFANIISDPTAAVLGVLYEISEDDMEHIALTEGVPVGNYHRITVPVAPLETPDRSVSAVTLTSDRRDASLQPSTRYMEFLVAGAIEHGLPDDYIGFLRSVPSRPSTEEAATFRAFLDQAMQRKTTVPGS